MLKLKTAQVPDFTNVDVRRLLGYITEEKSKCEDKLRAIAQIQEQVSLIFQGIPSASLQDLQSSGELWEMIQSVVGDDHWATNPSAGWNAGSGSGNPTGPEKPRWS